ncbi:four helix bundle protein [Chryseobacterium carnipullorum]|uniref:Four helix bundle protein n=1 Tax=Chryseobacterium carnipullorum TaxID=1124835 RepID=A0A1M7N7J1_CHRCU|nr:four helix bundle protein [Chryseobacterium carnipullorum]MDN5421872.1 four helix bundle protein [Chryseobacterium sp.]AZA47309.1 four helix bundle protein [Chryseobacterium carnipullorum]AZA66652.1 four helix bundle protein [Chryseobacterium carnipullorum]MDN5475573.1 four helix bundle protein [Chryseobacterium sp.]MDN5480117.1 four helix bundle protein [Chryseobacterium sp.]
MSRDYTQLEVWNEGRKLVVLLDSFTKKNLRKELSDFTSLIRRAVTSVPLNMAEGCGTRISKDPLQFLHIAGGSLYELETQLCLSLGQNEISKKDFEKVTSKILLCKKLISGFINHYKKIEHEK